MCTRVRIRVQGVHAYMRGYFLAAIVDVCCMRMVQRRTVGDAPQTKGIGSGYVHASRAHGHVRRDTAVHVYVIPRARVWHAVLCSSVCTAVGIMSYRVSRSMTLTCALSVLDDSPTSVHAQRLRITKIRQAGARVHTAVASDRCRRIYF